MTDTPTTEEIESLARNLQRAASEVDACMHGLNTGLNNLMTAFGNLSAYIAAENTQLKAEVERLRPPAILIP